MDVENVQDLFVQSDVGSQAASPLPSAGTDVVVLMGLNRKTRQDDVAVPSPVVPPVLTERKMETQLLSQKPGLILFGETILAADNLLEGDDIGIGFTQYLDNAIGPHTPIHASAFVNVISNNPEKRTKLTHESKHSRQRTKPMVTRRCDTRNPEVTPRYGWRYTCSQSPRIRVTHDRANDIRSPNPIGDSLSG